MFSLIWIVALTQLWVVAVDTRIICADTPNWYNGFNGANGGKGFTCSEYVTQGWCANGAVILGQEWALGPKFNNPEQNCCVCGKRAIHAADTPNWYNGFNGANDGKGFSCLDYVISKWCANGAVVPGSEWTLGSQFNNPEQNCYQCGKPDPNAVDTTVGCADTPNWYNGFNGANDGKGFTCSEYVTQGWCANGAVVLGQEWAVGPQFNNPEQNCCVCGKRATNAADTPNWYNGFNGANDGKGFSCLDYVISKWCANGAVVPGSEWTLGSQFNFPEKNCYQCGKPC